MDICIQNIKKITHWRDNSYHVKAFVDSKRIRVFHKSKNVNGKTFKLLQNLEDSAEETNCFFQININPLCIT